MPTVSVIIPTYKHRDFVLATLDSVFAQTFTDYEIIVINDGSPDDTAEVLRPLAEAGRIRYIEQANTGQSRARNRGIEEAQGEFIALLDDDDLWPPDKLEWQVEALRSQKDAGAVAGPACVVDNSGNFIQRTTYVEEIIFEESLVNNPLVSPGQILIRAKILEHVGGFNSEIWGADDWDLWLRIAKVSRVVMEDRDALLYRQHEGNASNDLCRMLDNCFLVIDLHLPDVPAASRKKVLFDAYQWFYWYIGGRIVCGTKIAIKSGNGRLVSAYVSRLMKLGRVLFADPVTQRRFASDVLPVRVSARLYRRTQEHTLKKETAQ